LPTYKPPLRSLPSMQPIAIFATYAIFANFRPNPFLPSFRIEVK
jgi:hypothetical protein